jgi:hypothetical protein
VRQLELRIPTALAILSLLALAPVANAADEDGDAGDLPATAQDLTGAGVGAINGTIRWARTNPSSVPPGPA